MFAVVAARGTLQVFSYIVHSVGGCIPCMTWRRHDEVCNAISRGVPTGLSVSAAEDEHFGCMVLEQGGVEVQISKQVANPSGCCLCEKFKKLAT